MFGAESIGAIKLATMVKTIMAHKALIKSKIATDDSFAAKVLFAVDLKSQRWLKDCRKAKGRDEVNDRILDADDLIDDIVNHRFNLQLPHSFKMTLAEDKVEPSPSSPEQPGKPGQPGKGKKGKKQKTQGEGAPYENENPDQDFKLLPGE